MENQDSTAKRKSTTFRIPRIAVTIALVICLFTPWLSGCGGPYPGGVVLLAGVVSPLGMPEATSSGNVNLLSYISVLLLPPTAISLILYLILNLRKAVRGAGSAYWRISTMFGSMLFLIMVYSIITGSYGKPNGMGGTVRDELLWGYWLTWVVILAAGMVEVLDKWKSNSTTDDSP